MKKYSCTLLALGAIAGTASAQSSVTLFGTIDVTARYVKADGQHRRLSEATDGLNSNQLGLRGVEDLGGGLKAGFTLLSGISPDTGSQASSSRFWNRRSTVSIFSNAGELRLGRDYVPTFWPVASFDAFGIVGLGAAANVHQMYEGTRQDNTIGYFLPPGLGGFYGHTMFGAAEGGSSGDKPTRYIGGRLGFASGPFDVTVAGGQRRFAAVTTQGSPGLTGANPGAVAQIGDLQRTYDIGASWNFGFAKLMGSFDREKLRNIFENIGSISAVIPIGLTEIHVGYDRSTLKNATGTGSSNAVDQAKISFVYNASKRSAIFVTASRLDNKDASRLTLAGAAGQTKPGGKSQAAEVGIRHFF